MRDLGPETEETRALREWFAEQEKKNVDRLEEGAKNIIQLVTGLYGVLFAVLALSDQPAYLKLPQVQVLGITSLGAFFVALIAAVIAVHPWRTGYQEDNITEMQGEYRRLLRRKAWSVRVALWLFLLGMALLAWFVALVLLSDVTASSWLLQDGRSHAV